MRFWIFAGLMLAIPSYAGEPGYKVVQSVQIAQHKLQILEDKRLTPSLENQLWAVCVDPVDVLGDDDPAAEPFIKAPLVPAKLRLRDRRGAIVTDVVLDEQSPIARIEKQTLGTSSSPIFMVRFDNSACMGSYSGQVVEFFVFANGRLTKALATDGKGHSEAVRGIETLKSGWRLVRSNPDDIIIELLLCRPDFKADKKGPPVPAFKLIYTTYRYHGGRWRMARREEPGFWEVDQGLPKNSKFPRVQD